MANRGAEVRAMRARKKKQKEKPRTKGHHTPAREKRSTQRTSSSSSSRGTGSSSRGNERREGARRASERVSGAVSSRPERKENQTISRPQTRSGAISGAGSTGRSGSMSRGGSSSRSGLGGTKSGATSSRGNERRAGANRVSKMAANFDVRDLSNKSTRTAEVGGKGFNESLRRAADANKNFDKNAPEWAKKAKSRTERAYAVGKFAGNDMASIVTGAAASAFDGPKKKTAKNDVSGFNDSLKRAASLKGSGATTPKKQNNKYYRDPRTGELVKNEGYGETGANIQKKLRETAKRRLEASERNLDVATEGISDKKTHKVPELGIGNKLLGVESYKDVQNRKKGVAGEYRNAWGKAKEEYLKNFNAQIKQYGLTDNDVLDGGLTVAQLRKQGLDQIKAELTTGKNDALKAIDDSGAGKMSNRDLAKLGIRGGVALAEFAIPYAGTAAKALKAADVILSASAKGAARGAGKKVLTEAIEGGAKRALTEAGAAEVKGAAKGISKQLLNGGLYDDILKGAGKKISRADFRQNVKREILANAIQDATLGASMDAATAKSQGLEGKDFAKYMGTNALMNVALGTPMSMIAGRTGRAGRAALNSDITNVLNKEVRNLNKLSSPEWKELKELQGKLDAANKYKAQTGSDNIKGLTEAEAVRYDELTSKVRAMSGDVAMTDKRGKLVSTNGETKASKALENMGFQKMSRESLTEMQRLEARAKNGIATEDEMATLTTLKRQAEDIAINNAEVKVKTKKSVVEATKKLNQSSEKTGVEYAVKNNEDEIRAELAEFGINPDAGKTVNGVTVDLGNGKKRVYIDGDYEGALYTVLGHEFAHTLAGSQHFKALKEAVKEYSLGREADLGGVKANEYDLLRAEFERRYGEAGELRGKSEEEIADYLDEEVTAEVIGRHIFGDDAEDFIKHLSTKDRNLFQRIYDYIKRALVNASDDMEKRQLYAIKEQIEKAYRDVAKEEIANGAKFRFDDDRLAPVFFSEMEEAAKKLGKNRRVGGDPQDIRRFFKKHGVKDEELKWVGIDEWLEKRREAGMKSVTTPELVDFIRSNSLELEVKTRASEGGQSLGGFGTRGVEEVYSIVNRFEDDVASALDVEDYFFDADYKIADTGWSVYVEAVKREQEEGKVGVAAYLYDNTGREVEEIAYGIDADDFDDALLNSLNRNWEEIAGSQGDTNWGDYTLQGGENYREYEYIMPSERLTKDYANQAMSTHWGDKNVVAHARIQDFHARSTDLPSFDEITRGRIDDIASRISKRVESEGDDFVYNEYPLDDDGRYTISIEHTPDKPSTRKYTFEIYRYDEDSPDGAEVLLHTNHETPSAEDIGTALDLVSKRRARAPEDSQGVLFIEEIQSDWHNAGAQKGYTAKTKNGKPQLSKKSEEVIRELNSFAQDERLVDEMATSFDQSRDSWRLGSSKPFVGQVSKNYMVRITRSGNVTVWDRNAQVDVANYNLAGGNMAVAIETVEAVDARGLFEYLPDDVTQAFYESGVPDAPYKTTYTDYAMKRAIREAAENERDYVAWTTAAQQEARWSSSYAEGYRIEYDQDMVSFANRYAKQFDPDAKVEKITLAENGEKVWALKISENMKKSVLEKGQARFKLSDGKETIQVGRGGLSSRTSLQDATTEITRAMREGDDAAIASIRAKTGWYRGEDGRWLNDINIKAMKFDNGIKNNDALHSDGGGFLGEEVSGLKNLFEEFPDLEYATLRLGDIGDEIYQIEKNGKQVVGITLNKDLTIRGSQAFKSMNVDKPNAAVQDALSDALQDIANQYDKGILKAYDTSVPEGAATPEAIKERAKMNRVSAGPAKYTSPNNPPTAKFKMEETYEKNYKGFQKKMADIGYDTSKENFGLESGEYFEAMKGFLQNGDVPDKFKASTGEADSGSNLSDFNIDFNIRTKDNETYATFKKKMAETLDSMGYDDQRKLVKEYGFASVGDPDDTWDAFRSVLIENGDLTPKKKVVPEPKDALDEDEAIKYVSEVTGFDEAKSKKTLEMVVEYLGDEYVVKSAGRTKYVKAINDYVSAAPAYALEKGEALYRGIGFDDEDVFNGIVDKLLDHDAGFVLAADYNPKSLRGGSPSSWTIGEEVAESFSSWNNDKKFSIIARCHNNINGTPVGNIAPLTYEREVLFGSHSRWTVLGVDWASDNKVYVDVIERASNAPKPKVMYRLADLAGGDDSKLIGHTMKQKMTISAEESIERLEPMAKDLVEGKMSEKEFQAAWADELFELSASEGKSINEYFKKTLLGYDEGSEQAATLRKALGVKKKSESSEKSLAKESGKGYNDSKEATRNGKEELDEGTERGLQEPEGEVQKQPARPENSGTVDKGRGRPDTTERPTRDVLSEKDTEVLKKHGVSTKPLSDVSEEPDRFITSLKENADSQKYGAAVDVDYSPDDIRGAKLITNDDGSITIGVKPDGDIFGLAKRAGSDADFGEVMYAAIANGGEKCDYYGKGLANKYQSFGIEPVARIPFNEDVIRMFANSPEEADAKIAALKEIGHDGQGADVYVGMHTGESLEQIATKRAAEEYKVWSQEDLDNLKTFTGEDAYDDALAYRDKLLGEQTLREYSEKVLADVYNGAYEGKKVNEFLRAAKKLQKKGDWNKRSAETLYRRMMYPTDVNNPKAVPSDDVLEGLSGVKAYQDYQSKPRSEQLKEQRPSLEDVKRRYNDGEMSGYNLSQHYVLMRDSDYFAPKEIHDQMERDIRAGYYSKKKRESYTDAIDRAQKAVEDDFDAAYARQINKLDNEMLTAYDDAERRFLLNELIRRVSEGEGDVAKNIEMHKNLAINQVANASSTGAALAALRTLKQMTPEDWAGVMLKKVDQINKRYADRMKGTEIKLTDEQFQRIAKCKSEDEVAGVFADIMDELMEDVPSTLFEKINEVRRFMMLANIRTHERNIFGNSFFFAARTAADLMELGAYKIPAVRKRLESLGGTATKNKMFYMDFRRANGDFLESEFKRVYKGSGSATQYKDVIKGIPRPKAFKNKTINKILDANYGALEWEDMFMFKPEFNKAYAEWCNAHKIDDVAKMTDNQKELAGQYALRKAEYATFRDDSTFSKAITKFKTETAARKGKRLGGTVAYRAMNTAIEGHLPFVKTPINILRRSADFSPVGLTRGLALIGRAETPAAFEAAVHDVCTGLTGTGVALFGGFLASRGLVTVEAGDVSFGEDEKGNKLKADAYYNRLAGYQDYSLVVGPDGRKYSVSIDWASPMQTSLFMGAAMWEKVSEDGFSPQDFCDVAIKVFDPMLDMSFMQTSKDTFETFMDKVYRNGTGDNADWTGAITQTVFGRIPQGYLGSLVPQMLSQVATGADKYQRDTRSTKESSVAASYESWARQIANKFPVLRWHVNDPKLDQHGKDKMNTGGDNVFMRFVNAMINPSNVKRINLDDTDRELIGIYNKIPDNDKNKKYFWNPFTGNPDYELTNGKRMSYKDLHDYGAVKRQTQVDNIKAMIASKSYKDMTNGMKVDEIDGYGWIAQIKADQSSFGDKYALEKIIGSKGMVGGIVEGAGKVKAYKDVEEYVTNDIRAGGKTDAQAWRLFRDRNGNNKDSMKKFVDFWVTKETLIERAHHVDYYVKGFACALTGNSELARAYDINTDKVKLAEDYVGKKNKAWKGGDVTQSPAYKTFTNACCNIAEQLERYSVESTSKANRSWAAAGHKDIDEATYRAMGFDWDSAQSGAGLRNYYKHSADELISMASDAKYEFDVDESGSLSKEETISYIESLGWKSKQHKACLFAYLKPNAKNPYGSINDYLEWGENKDEDDGKGGRGRRGRRRRRGRGGRGGGGGSTGGTGTPPKTATGAFDGKVTDVTKGAGRSSVAATENVAVKSNLNDAYRKKAKKLRDAQRR